MQERRDFRRTTTNPLRGRPPGRSNGGGKVVFLAIAVLVFAGSLQMFRGGGSDSSRDPCTGKQCVSEALAPLQPSPQPAPGFAVASTGVSCPYCNQDPGRWTQSTTVQPPQLTARSAVVVEGSCGRMVYGLRQDDRAPPASLTKVVTALVVADKAKPSDRVDIKVNGWDLVVEDGSSIMGLENGMNLSVEELLYGLLLPSGNDAAIALADHLGGARSFVDQMNQRVQKLGLKNSRFANPDGRDAADQYTSALDIALLGRELMANPTLKRIAGTQTYTKQWDNKLLWNANYLVYGYKGATGIKIGYTEAALETMVGSAVRDGRELYVAVLGSDWAYIDTTKLFDWVFTNTKPAC